MASLWQIPGEYKGTLVRYRGKLFGEVVDDEIIRNIQEDQQTEIRQLTVRTLDGKIMGIMPSELKESKNFSVSEWFLRLFGIRTLEYQPK